ERASRKPTTGFVGLCARATNEYAAVPTTPVMKSRRLMSAPRLRSQHRSGSTEYFCRAETRFATATRDADQLRYGSLALFPAYPVMSSIPPKAAKNADRTGSMSLRPGESSVRDRESDQSPASDRPARCYRAKPHGRRAAPTRASRYRSLPLRG